MKKALTDEQRKERSERLKALWAERKASGWKAPENWGRRCNKVKPTSVAIPGKLYAQICNFRHNEGFRTIADAAAVIVADGLVGKNIDKPIIGQAEPAADIQGIIVKEIDRQMSGIARQIGVLINGVDARLNARLDAQSNQKQ